MASVYINALLQACLEVAIHAPPQVLINSRNFVNNGLLEFLNSHDTLPEHTVFQEPPQEKIWYCKVKRSKISTSSAGPSIDCRTHFNARSGTYLYISCVQACTPHYPIYIFRVYKPVHHTTQFVYFVCTSLYTTLPNLYISCVQACTPHNPMAQHNGDAQCHIFLCSKFEFKRQEQAGVLRDLRFSQRFNGRFKSAGMLNPFGWCVVTNSSENSVCHQSSCIHPYPTQLTAILILIDVASLSTSCNHLYSAFQVFCLLPWLSVASQESAFFYCILWTLPARRCRVHRYSFVEDVQNSFSTGPPLVMDQITPLKSFKISNAIRVRQPKSTT